jgi:hypothetical protein
LDTLPADGVKTMETNLDELRKDVDNSLEKARAAVRHLDTLMEARRKAVRREAIKNACISFALAVIWIVSVTLLVHSLHNMGIL